jgi:hypothetical protein
LGGRAAGCARANADTRRCRTARRFGAGIGLCRTSSSTPILAMREMIRRQCRGRRAALARSCRCNARLRRAVQITGGRRHPSLDRRCTGVLPHEPEEIEALARASGLTSRAAAAPRSPANPTRRRGCRLGVLFPEI